MDDFIADINFNRNTLNSNRHPFTMSIMDITSNGIVTIYFSEELYSIEDFLPNGMTFDLFQRLRY